MDKLISVTILILIFLTSFGMAYVDYEEEEKECQERFERFCKDKVS